MCSSSVWAAPGGRLKSLGGRCLFGRQYPSDSARGAPWNSQNFSWRALVWARRQESALELRATNISVSRWSRTSTGLDRRVERSSVSSTTDRLLEVSL